MDSLSAVSETALFTLRSRVIESEMGAPVIEDPVGSECLKRLQAHLPTAGADGPMQRPLPPTLTRHIALRASKYDAYTRTFIQEHPDGLVVSLGCGFDTRYWRVSATPWRYVEVDLPDVIAAKQQVLGDLISYPTIGGSVLEDGWIQQVSAMQTSSILFLAEGLLMYLPKDEVIQLFQALSTTFSDSQIVVEVVNERYTRGIWKKGVESKMKRALGSDAGASYDFGIRNAAEIETYGRNIRVVEEWSYLEDERVLPKMLYRFRNVPLFSRTQWTVRALMG